MVCATTVRPESDGVSAAEAAREWTEVAASAGASEDLPSILQSVVELLIDRVIETELRRGAAPARDREGSEQ